MSQKMHADEVHTDAALVRRLLAAQLPHWAHLPIEPVPSTGTENAIYRLGADMAVRLPRLQSSVHDLEKECEWLPKFAPHLPLAVPQPLARGTPGEGYPLPWAVFRWLDGEIWNAGNVRDLSEAATDLAAFIAALRRIDAPKVPGSLSGNRGVSLPESDPAVRAAIAASDGLLDTAAVTAAWDEALRAPAWDGQRVWIHGDLHRPGNLLVAGGRLSAVIDFGTLNRGDPAYDLIAAWSLFSGQSRAAFRAALSVDDGTWARSRGWALTFVMAVPYYIDTNPVIFAEAQHAIAEVLADQGHGA